VRAQGNVRLNTPEGDRAYGETVVLDGELRDGVIENLLVVLEKWRPARGRARDAGGRRLDAGARRLHRLRGGGREWLPQGSDLADHGRAVIHEPARRRIRYEGATLNLFGIPIIGPAGPVAPGPREGAADRACWCPTCGSAAPTASSSASLIICGSRPIATPPSPRTSSPTRCR
jgi:LPS-assembly protein